MNCDGGYQGSLCHSWVPFGVTHACTGYYADPPMAPAPPPVIYYTTDPKLTELLEQILAALERIERQLPASPE